MKLSSALIWIGNLLHSSAVASMFWAGQLPLGQL